MPAEKIKVLIVDDSVFARKIVAGIIDSCSELEVVGWAVNGKDGVAKAKKLRPDVITMDVEMPELDGIETLKQIMKEIPTPVIMLSSLTVSGAVESVKAFRYGAVDVMAKPHGSHSMGLTAIKEELIDKIIAASNVDIARLQSSSAPLKKAHVKSQFNSIRTAGSPIVVIASSTGGPRALRELVPSLPCGHNVAYLIVQHLPEGFSKPLAQDLNTLTELNVKEAEEDQIMKPGDVIFAKAGSHCVVKNGGRISLSSAPTMWGVRPAADITFISAVDVFKSNLIGVVLTGMGRDGADGICAIKKAGGITIAEHESSCVVYGMPRSAVETGCVDIVVPLQFVAEAINGSLSEVCKKRKVAA